MRIMLLPALCLGLGACSKPAHDATPALAAYDISEPPAPARMPNPAAPQADQIRVSVPRMAYSYKYSFILPGTSITHAQEAHVALCDRLGPMRCQLLVMDSESGDDHAAKASLKLRVESASARQFGVELEKAVSGAGGREVDHSIAAEDVSKDLVDTQARIHQRELLVERLTEILRTRKGTVAELVEAERSVATAQEELDQAKGWLGELESRVAMSTIDVDYAAAAITTEHVGNSLGETVAASGNAFVIAIGAILRLFILSGPWLILAVIGWWGWRRLRTRLYRAANPGEEEASPLS